MPYTKNGVTNGDLASYALIDGDTLKLKVIRVLKDGDDVRLEARVTNSPNTAYRKGEILNLRDTVFITRRARAGEPPNDLIIRALRAPGRSFIWHDTYGQGWTIWDRPPGNAPFWTIDGQGR